MNYKKYNRLNLSSGTIFFVACVSVFTLCYCAFFNYPAGDDYGYAYRITRDGCWNSLIDTYISWSGRYAATIVSFINPFLIGGVSWLFSAYSIFIILAFVGSIFFFVYQMLFEVSLYEKLLVVAFVVCVLLAGMPSYFEAFYWFSAYISYLLPLILIFLFLGIFLLAKRNSSYWGYWKKIIVYAVLSFLIFFVNGCNELAVIVLDCIIAFLLLVEKEKKILYLFFGVAMISTLLMFIAPGNFARLAESNSQINVAYILFYATSFSFVFLVKNLLLLVGMSIAYIFLVLPHVGKKKVHINISPILFAIFVFIVIWFLHLFMFLSTDTKPLERTENIVFVFLVIAWIIGLYFFMPNTLVTYIRTHENYLVSNLVLLLFLCLMCNYDSSLNATFADIFSGNIKQFAKERQEQIDIQINSNTPTTIVPALTVAPKTLTYTLYDEESKLSSVISPGEPIYGTQPIFENDTVRVQDNRLVWKQIKSNLKDRLLK